MHIRRAALALTALLVVAPLAACGDDDDTAAADTAGTEFPVTVDGVTIEERPERIVSLSASSTEMLFAIGAGDRVVAVDLFSNYPDDVPEGDLDAYEPNIEAIADKEPDLVVASAEIEGLDTLGIPVLVHDAAVTIDDTYAQLEALGRATGNVDGAEEVTEEIRDGIEEVVADADDTDGLTYYWELTPDLYSATSRTFIGALLAELGLENIADEAPGGAGDYPQLSSEFVVDADPDLIILADTKCCDQDADAVGGRPGWSRLAAVEGNGVVELDDDIASRWGPRIVELLEQVADASAKVSAG